MTDAATVAANLAKIIDMAGRLRARAIDRSNDRNIVGGDSLVELGHVASLTDWGRRVELAEEAGDYDKGNSEDPETMWPAVQLLWYWSEGIRQQLGHNHDDPRWRPTLTSEAQFLRNRDVADWIWNNTPNWDDYAKDVSRAKNRLETTLLEGERAERIRVICGNPDCDDPRKLIRVYARKHPTEWTCDACGAESDNPEPCDHCQSDSLRETWWESDDADDRWKCPNCKHHYTADEVRDLFAKQLKLAADDRWVQVSHAVQLLGAFGWQERVIRRWINPDPKKPAHLVPVEKRRDALSGRHEVRWSTIWRRHLWEQNAREQAAKERQAS